ncbi:MAG TPA: hypothetical protein VH142_09850 [Polyangiaceae bacterium]|nr:hypothetical protein [Polyangiaceae bacterium]
MTVALARRLVWEGAVAADEANRALLAHVTRRLAFLEALIEGHAELETRLGAELAHGPSVASVASVIVDPELMKEVPRGLCAALAAVPIGRNLETGDFRVVSADPSDTHVASEFGFHLGGKVEILGAPLDAVLAAIRTHDRPRGSLAPLAPSSHASEPPIPLVRLSIEPSRVPGPIVAEPVITLTRARSLAPEPSSVRATVPSSRASVSPPSVSILGPLRIPITTPSSVPPMSTPPTSTPPITVPQGTPFGAQPKTEILGTPTSSVAERHATATFGTPTSAVREGAPGGALRSTAAFGTPKAVGSSPPPSSTRAEPVDFDEASSPDELTRMLVNALTRVASRVVAFAVRGRVFEGRDSNDAASRSKVRALIVPMDTASVLSTAVKTGQYLGPLPETAVHAELAALLGRPNEEIAVGAVTVSGRAALLYVLAGFRTAYLTTRRATELGQAAGRALERMVRERKR